MSVALSRRDFLQITATGLGGLMVSAWLPPLRAQEAATEPAWLRSSLDLFVRVEPDERVIIGARSCEIGQGVRTSLPMLIAEELDVDWSKVTVEQLPYGLVAADNEQGLDFKYGPQGAGGSTNIPEGWLELRQVGARVRHLFLQAAAKRWNAPLDSLSTEAGRVLHPDGRHLSYGELAELARTMPVSDKPLPLKAPDKFRIIGRETRVADGADVVTGRARFGIDGGIPGSLVAVIARCPYFEGTLESVDDSASRAIPGVRDILPIPGPTAKEGLVRNLAAGVAVVADDTWAALQGRKALKIKWRPTEWAGDDSDTFRESAFAALRKDGKVARQDGDVKGARAKAKRVVEAEYFQPFLAHCTMEPMNASLELKKDSALLIASLQSPGGASRMIHDMTGISRLNIDIHLPRSGGGFGRRLENDFVAEAVHVAQKVRRPIKLIWTREDDIQNDWYRPSGAHGMTAFLNEKNELTGWSHRVAAADRGFRQPDFAERLVARPATNLCGFPHPVLHGRSRACGRRRPAGVSAQASRGTAGTEVRGSRRAGPGHRAHGGRAESGGKAHRLRAQTAARARHRRRGAFRLRRLYGPCHGSLGGERPSEDPPLRVRRGRRPCRESARRRGADDGRHAGRDLGGAAARDHGQGRARAAAEFPRLPDPHPGGGAGRGSRDPAQRVSALGRRRDGDPHRRAGARERPFRRHRETHPPPADRRSAFIDLV
ncbi:MAG: xanthine dehydrogenase family protein molybdopterin-binding subunit [Gammaproteobacteria bacterium]|nr:xanthine dehydrogenase family protein molybdopterin-binding subunit [Gammaproteobacteria bacterium]